MAKAYLKLFVSMKYVNKVMQILTKELIPPGFPMSSLFYFFHMFLLVKHIIQTGVPLSFWRSGVCLQNTGDIPQRSRGS